MSSDLASAQRLRRALVLGGGCTLSPSMQYLACESWGTISIYDTLLAPDEDGVVDDTAGFTTPVSWSDDDDTQGVQTAPAWDADGHTLYAVTSLASGLVLTSVEEHPSAAESWIVTDRPIVGIDAHIRSLEVDPSGTVLISDDEHHVYRLDPAGAAGASLAPSVASAAELRHPP